MKKIKTILLSLMALAMTVGATACDQVLNFLNPNSSVESSVTGGSVNEKESSETTDSTGSTDSNESSDSTPEVDEWAEYETITIAEALELCGESGKVTTDRYYIRGIITTVSNPEYGGMTVKDETGSIAVYGTYSADGELRYSQLDEKPVKGDEVLLHCILQNYNGTKEVKNARLIDFKSNAGNIDTSAYTEMSIAQAREADEGELVKVDGVVARITYAFGMKPNGVMLVDETQSIYVFDGDLAGQVAVGNQVTILAEKAYWVLESEQSAAEKHGYRGCNQLTDVQIVSNDKGNHEFDKTWIEESAMKDIVENPVSNDITTTIYKVNALVEKRDGSNYVNYYFFDLDGETGGYAYTQCNGSDFAWIDQFDGKICTVYLTALNAKSSDTACFYRFLPIAIEDDGYEFDVVNAPQFALDYYAMDQFDTAYTADPEMLLTTSVSSELLGFEGVKVSYESNNTDVVYFEETQEGMVFHCGIEGKATVTVKAVYGEVEASETIEITVSKPIVYETITVAQAIEAEVDSEVMVKGIVGPSVVNKNGFYLFGEDGSMIAVLVNSTQAFQGLEIGHEIILKGMRERYVNDDNATYAGQTCIVNAEILVNNYGTHEYSTAKFVTDKTGKDFYDLDETVDYSTTVFVFETTIKVVGNGYSTRIALDFGESNTISVYCGSANQYEWLKVLENQKVTVEIAACNWNNKTFWAGCVLAVRNADGTKVLNTLNFDNY